MCAASRVAQLPSASLLQPSSVAARSSSARRRCAIRSSRPVLSFTAYDKSQKHGLLFLLACGVLIVMLMPRAPRGVGSAPEACGVGCEIVVCMVQALGCF